MLYLAWQDQTSLTKQRSESLYKRVVVLYIEDLLTPVVSSLGFLML